MEFKISVVMAAYNSGDYIARAIESIIDQTFSFKKNIQLIIVNDASYDNTLEVINHYKEKYPDNITVIDSKENHGAAHSRNIGLAEVKGEFVNFLDSDDYITDNAFKKAWNFFKKHDEVDIVSIPIYFFGARKGGHNLNFKFEETRVVNLLDNPDFIQLSGASSFFRYSRIKDHVFDEELRVSEDPLFINQLLIKNPLIGFLDDCGYYYRKHDASTSLIGSSTNYKSYYTSRVDGYFIQLIRDSLDVYGRVPEFIQNVIMYDLFWLASVEDVSFVLDSRENLILYAKLIQILDYIDVNVILNQQLGNNLLNVHLFLLKTYKTDYFKNKAIVCSDSVLPKKDLKFISNALDIDKLVIDNIEFLNDSEIYFSGLYTTFLSDESDIIVDCDGREIKTKRLIQPQRDNYSLNFNYAFNHCFEVVVPVSNRISFKSDGGVLDIEYSETSRLSRISKYYLSTNHLAIDRGNYIEVVKRTPLTTFKNEAGVLKSMLSNRQQGWRTGVILRLLYFITYNIYNSRRIWIFMDLPDRADDNGLKLFRYAVDNKPFNIDKVFTISKSDKNYNNLSGFGRIKKLIGGEEPSKEFEKVSKVGYVLPYKSMKHRLYALFAEVIITSNPDNDIIYPFWGNFKHVSGLVRSKTVFLQHGVTLHNISSWLNNYNKHLSLLACVSEKEREAFLNSEYGYSEDAIQVLGFPRFDYLTNIGDKKEIVVMPTWRRRYEFFNNEEFKHCEYFKKFNKLLNDTDLIEFLDDNGYKLIFKPHPKFVKFLDCFDKSPKVEFSNAEYSEVFNHASLLITDFSSVAFDFAYLKKALIYYHVDVENFHFDIADSYFDYDEMGFGPVVDDVNDLIAEIKNLVKNECKMSDIYQKRVDEFFKYQDKENSKRVYEAILELDNYY